MAINRHYEYNEENKLLYNIDNYTVNSGLAVDFVNGSAQLRNINVNHKSANFFGNGSLGSQTYIADKGVEPTAVYFRNLYVDDSLYGTHLEGIWAALGEFNVGDELILYKRHCADKSLYDEIGKWDIVTVVEIIIDPTGNPRYVLDKAPDNSYDDNTINSATVVLQFESLTIGGQMYLSNEGKRDIAIQSVNRRERSHPDKGDLWRGRTVSDPSGIMYVKVREELLMLEGSSMFNHLGTYGGKLYSNRAGWALDVTEINHSHHTPACGFLPSPSDNSVSATALPASDLCDYAGYNGTGGGNFYNDGFKHSNELYASRQMKAEHKGNSELDKIFYGMAGAAPAYDYRWAFGPDGGGITIVQAKKTIMKEGAMITTAPIFRKGTYDGHPCGTAGGGTTILKCPEIEVLSEKPIISSMCTHVDETEESTTADILKFRGMHNPGVCIMEFENLTLADGSVNTFEEVIAGFDTFKEGLFKDIGYLNSVPEGVLTAENLIREQEYVHPAQDEDLIINAPTKSMAEYETGKYYKVFTQGLHNIDVSLWNLFNGFKSKRSIVADTHMRFLLSRDGGSTWFKLNNDTDNFSNVNLADIDQGNTIEDLETYFNTITLTSQLIALNADKTLDLCVGMMTEKSYKTPTIDNFEFLYQGVIIPDAPIRILPYHEEEFDKEMVDFVWMQPLQLAGSLQNRLEISPTSNFEPTLDQISVGIDSPYSNTANKLHIPFSSKLVDNYYNSMSDLILPYMLTKGLPAENTYSENKTSGGFDEVSNKLTYKGDTFFVRGNSLTLPNNEILVPDYNTLAPLRSDVDVHEWSIKMSDHAVPTNGGGLEQDGVQINTHSYVGDVAYFNGQANYSRLVPNADKASHPLIETNRERTLHFKFNVKSIAGRGDLMSIRKNATSTTMIDLMIHPDYFTFNGVHSYFLANTYMDQEKVAADVEQNITITCSVNNEATVYLNGRKVIENVVYNKHLTYVDDPDDICDIGMCFGLAYPGYTSYGFIGNYHEVVCYDHMKTEEEILEISKLPNFHRRYDLRTNEFKLLQLPYNNEDFMYNNELWNNNAVGINAYATNAFTPTMLSNIDNCGYNSNNDSILIGKYYPSTLAINNYTNVNSVKGIVMGYGYYTNWIGLSSVDQYTLKSNNTIQQNYTGGNHVMVKTGRINKQTTATELEFYYSQEDRTRTTMSYIGITYGLYSVTNVQRYFARIERQTSLVVRLHVYLYNSHYYVDLPSFDSGHRYTLSMVPIDGSFQTNFVVRMYSKTNKKFEDNPILFSSGESHGYNTVNRGFASKDYADRLENKTSGDWVDVGAELVSIDKEFSLVGLTCLDDSSNITRDNGYNDSYFIEKRLPAGITYNIIRMDVVSEITSALVYVKSVISFDSGLTWKVYVSATGIWEAITDLSKDNVKINAMTDADLYAVTDSVAVDGGFNANDDTVVRTYLLTDDNSMTPHIISHKVEKNGPRIIDSWKEPGSYYRDSYEWHYLNDGTWNPYLEVDTTGTSGQTWEDFGTAIPSPTVFVDEHGAKPSTNLLKTYSHVKVDCLPKGKWYWRVSAYNGLKK